jgi:glycosyltransferase involved in cell wall biosynthesis
MNKGKMRIGLLYAHTNKPWGGVNTFFRAFASRAARDANVVLADVPYRADIVLSVGHFYAPGRMLTERQVCNISNGLPPWHPRGLFGGCGSKARLVWRLDGLRSVYAGGDVGRADSVLVRNLPLGTGTVFQSRFSQYCFDRAGYTHPRPDVIIHNGAAEHLFYPAGVSLQKGRKIVLVSNSWSTNESKGFEVLKAFATLGGVEVRHVGRWPQELDPGGVRLLGARTEPEIADILRMADFFLFSSQFDACSNAVVEALACGLPVIYHRSGGTPELCQDGRFGVGFGNDDDAVCDPRVVMDEAMERDAAMRDDLREHLAEYGFERCYVAYIEFFRKILESGLDTA